MGYVVSDNTPAIGSISWSNLHIVYAGVDYTIQDGYTDKKYVSWIPSISTTVLQVSDTLPSFLDLTDVIGHWKMNDNAADKVVLDSSGHALNGTSQANTNTMTVAGKINTALEFDGTIDYITVTDNDLFDFGTGDFAISFQMKTTATGTMMFLDIKDAETNIGWICYIVTGHNYPAFLIGDASGYTTGEFSSVTVNLRDGNWHHVILNFDRDGNVTPYVDGTPFTGISITSRSGSVSNNDFLRIGCSTTYTAKFTGALDDIRLYNHLLTTQEIANLYNGGNGTEGGEDTAEENLLVFLNKNGIHVTVPTTTVIDGSLIVSESILTDALSANCVTGVKILAGAVIAEKLAADSVIAVKIKAGEIGTDHLAASVVTAAKMAVGTITAASGIIADLAVETAKIKDLAVETIKIKDNAATQPATAYTASGGASGDIQSIEFTATGAPIFIHGGFVWERAVSMSGDYSYRIKLFRDSTLLYDTGTCTVYLATPDITYNVPLVVSICDSPSAGSYTYKLNLSVGGTAKERVMYIIETKK